MKKYVNRTILACMAALSLLTGCNKEEKDSKVFLLEMPEYGTQKTALNTSTKGTEWINGDVIYINGATADNTATVTVGDGKAVAKATADIPSDGNLFYACYPGNSENIVSYDPNTHSFTFILPVSRNAGELKAPFVGIGSKKDATGDKVIRFLNTCALLKVSNIESKDIVITDAAGKLAGEFSVAYNGSSWDAISATVNNTATANCTLTVINSGTADVYIPIPAGNHRLTVVNGCQESSMHDAQNLVAGKIYSINHWYVDLGLPSGILWATSNVGADKPEGYGKYYAWGETAAYMEKMVGTGANSGSNYKAGNTKTECNWAYYKWGKGENNLGKYVNKTGYGMTTPDNKKKLDFADDAAYMNWGGNWCMPTIGDMKELADNCTRTWTSRNSVKGIVFTSKIAGYTDRSIFLPASGYYDGKELTNREGSVVRIRSSSLSDDDPNRGRHMCCNEAGRADMNVDYRYYGFPIRPVYRYKKTRE